MVTQLRNFIARLQVEGLPPSPATATVFNSRQEITFMRRPRVRVLGENCLVLKWWFAVIHQQVTLWDFLSRKEHSTQLRSILSSSGRHFCFLHPENKSLSWCDGKNSFICPHIPSQKSCHDATEKSNLRGEHKSGSTAKQGSHCNSPPLLKNINAQWREVKQMQSVWLSLIKSTKKPLLIQTIWGHILQWRKVEQKPGWLCGSTAKAPIVTQWPNVPLHLSHCPYQLDQVDRENIVHQSP